MAGYNFRWGDDVQPYILRLASEHIETLSEYCHARIQKTLDKRDKRKTLVLALTPRLKPRVLKKARAVHRFDMLGFYFELRESPKLAKAKKPEFVLNFSMTPDFEPEHMPLRLRRVRGKPMSARPQNGRKPRGAAPARARTQRRRKKADERRIVTISYRLPHAPLWIADEIAALRSSLEAKLYKMYGLYQRLSARTAAMWRRRPRLGVLAAGVTFLTRFEQPLTNAPTRARLEPRLIGESIRLMLFTFVSREPVIEWDADLFGTLPDEGERIAV